MSRRITTAVGLVLVLTASTAAAFGLQQDQAHATNSQISVGLNFKAAGTLQQVLVAPGDSVTKGQVLAREDPTDANLALRAAQANLTKARAALDALTHVTTPQETAQQQQTLDQNRAAIAAAQQVLADTQAQANQDGATQQADVAAAEQALADAQAQAGQDASADQQNVASAQSQLSTDEGQLAADQQQLSADQAGNPSAVPSDNATIAADKSRIATDTNAVAQARNTESSTMLQNTQKIHVATANLTSAQQAGAEATLHDQQQVHGAQAAVVVAHQTLNASLATNAVTSEPPSRAAETAATADVTTAQVAVDEANLALAATTLTARADGTIVNIASNVGEYIAGGASGGATSGADTRGFITLNASPTTGEAP